MKWFHRNDDTTGDHPTPQPSDDARLARAFADHLTERADKVFAERRDIVDKNHFAARIRMSYEGLK